MATIGFYAGEDFVVYDAGGSGLGLHGGAFGTSITVNEYNTRTFITNSAGTVEGPEVDNIKWTHANSGIIGNAGSSVALTQIPNYKATLNIRFSHATPVKTINAEARVFDRSNIDAGPTGITFKIAELIHTGSTQVNNGSGDTSWITPSGSSVTVPFVDSPGTSGLSPSGSLTTDTQHDWYAAISCSPQTAGSKLAALYFSTEYL